jgi:hypothetical protein
MNDDKSVKALETIGHQIRHLASTPTGLPQISNELANISKSLREIKEHLRQIASNTKK